MEKNEQNLLFGIYSKVTLEESDENFNNKSDSAEINNYLFECIS